MTILIYFLTIVFGIVCFVIMKKKRYKVMPLICLIMFICFIGCGIVSILSLTLPYGEILVYPLGAIIFGLVFILVGVNDLYSLLRCREKVDGVYCGYNTYYGGNGISTQSPIFEYTYNGTYYREQTAQNISHAVRDLLTYYDAEQTAFSIINQYVRFVDEEPDKRKNDWKLNDRWAWFIGDNRQSLKLTTKPEPYTLDRTLRWVQRQVAPTLKMLKKIDKGNGTDYMETIEQQAKLTEKHEMIIKQQTTPAKDLVES